MNPRSPTKQQLQRAAQVFILYGGIAVFSTMIVPSIMYISVHTLPWLLPAIGISGLGFLIVGSFFFWKAQKAPDSTDVTTQTALQTSSSSSLEDALLKLDDLKQRAIIDEAEYKRLRENLINRS